jgi:hypothetical protein
MFTTDGARNARGRRRAPPKTFPASELGIEVRIAEMRFTTRERRLLDDQVAGRRLQVVVGAESEVRVAVLRRGVDPTALIATERLLRVVVHHDVLAELGPDAFEQVPEVADDGEVPEQRMFVLCEVVDDQRNECECNRHQQPRPPGHGAIFALARGRRRMLAATADVIRDPRPTDSRPR